MTGYTLDWLNLVFRWLHVITAIAWIGSSFYFVWLDNSLEEPNEDNKKKGFKGQLSSIHAGGFYEIGKYTLAPPVMPANLHWFKWEAYSTWITGFFLMTLMFYVGAETYLIDAQKVPFTVPFAILVSLLTLAGSWVIYDLLCKSPLAQNPWLLAAVLLAYIGLLAWGLEKIYSDRAAYLHIGAVIGTCMAANVFRVIMPGQRAMVSAIENHQSPDPKYAIASKLRSMHNNYLTLPVIFIMISNHYPMTYSHSQAWAVMLALIVIGAWARHFFNLKHKGIVEPKILISAALALLILAWVIAPEPVAAPGKSAETVSDETALAIVTKHCQSCHAKQTTDPMFPMAQAGVALDTIEQIRQWAPRIMARAVTSHDMPFMNKTKMTQAERDTLGQWILSQ